MTTAGGGWTVLSGITSDDPLARVVTGPPASANPFNTSKSYSLSLEQKSALSQISQVRMQVMTLMLVAIIRVYDFVVFMLSAFALPGVFVCASTSQVPDFEGGEWTR